jgi:hypothetical protein
MLTCLRNRLTIRQKLHQRLLQAEKEKMELLQKLLEKVK